MYMYMKYTPSLPPPLLFASTSTYTYINLCTSPITHPRHHSPISSRDPFSVTVGVAEE